MKVIFALMNTKSQHLAWFQSAGSSVSVAYVSATSFLVFLEQHFRTSCEPIKGRNLLAMAAHFHCWEGAG
jgi:hypothetical protein